MTNEKTIKAFREKWEDDTTCGGYIEEFVSDLRKALAEQNQELLEKIEGIKKEQEKEFSPEEWIGYCYAIRQIKKLL